MRSPKTLSWAVLLMAISMNDSEESSSVGKDDEGSGVGIYVAAPPQIPRPCSEGLGMTSIALILKRH